MSKIIGLSGRKQSGKSTVASFLHGMQMTAAGIIEDFRFSDEGVLVVPSQMFDKDGNEHIQYGEFKIDRKDDEFIDYMSVNVWPFVKLYSFADMLKTNICMQVLGLSYEQCYGTDKDKNTKTGFKWKDMPTKTKNSGSMTAREIMQYIGTDLFRHMDTEVWASSLLRQVQAEGSALSIICDCRFPNEVEQIQKAGGKVIRMNRNNHGDDDHASETILDPENFDWNKFDAVVDNQNMNVQQANEAVYQFLMDWELVDMEYQSN